MRFLPTHLTLTMLLLALLASGCRQAPRQGAGSAPGQTGGPGGAPVTPLSPTDPTTLRFNKVDMLITQWDVAQAAGRRDQAAQLALEIRKEVDQGFQDFLSSSRGQRGVRLKYLGVSALGFASRCEATQAIVDRLADDDRRLVGNALIALKVRADPNTDLGPVVRHVNAPASESRRYAPLALAAILNARWCSGLGVDSPTHKMIAQALSGVVADRDPYVRLHVAKALGSLRGQGTYELLMIMLKDEHIRIRLAAAAGMERLRDPRGFTEVVQVLQDVDDDVKPIVRDLLVSYGEAVAGRPLTPVEIEQNGTSGMAWARWYEAIRQQRGLPYEGPTRSPTSAPSPAQAATPTPRATQPLPAPPRPSTFPPPTQPGGVPQPRALPQPRPIPAPPRATGIPRSTVPSPPPPPPPSR